LSGPIPSRVEAAAKGRPLELIDEATGQGWPMARTCSVMQPDRTRAYRWPAPRAEGTRDDRAPGGNPIHGLLAEEEHAIVDLFDNWGPQSRRALARRALPARSR
jgi:putative transposase